MIKYQNNVHDLDSLVHECCQLRVNVFAKPWYTNKIIKKLIDLKDYDYYDYEVSICSEIFSRCVGTVYQQRTKEMKTAPLIDTNFDLEVFPNIFETTDAIIIANEYLDIFNYNHIKNKIFKAEDDLSLKLCGLEGYSLFNNKPYNIKLIRLHIIQPRNNNTSVFEIKPENLLKWKMKNKI